MTLLVVAVTIAGCYAFKALGFLVPEGLLERRTVAEGVRVLPVALLASLIVSQTIGGAGGINLDARLFGLAVAGLLLALRAPLALSLVAAIGATALLRLAIGL